MQYSFVIAALLAIVAPTINASTDAPDMNGVAGMSAPPKTPPPSGPGYGTDGAKCPAIEETDDTNAPFCDEVPEIPKGCLGPAGGDYGNGGPGGPGGVNGTNTDTGYKAPDDSDYAATKEDDLAANSTNGGERTVAGLSVLAAVFAAMAL